LNQPVLSKEGNTSFLKKQTGDFADLNSLINLTGNPSINTVTVVYKCDGLDAT